MFWTRAVTHAAPGAGGAHAGHRSQRSAAWGTLRLAFKSRLLCPPRKRPGRLIARRSDLLSNYLSQRFIDPVLPARPGVLKVIKNVPVNSQRDKLLGIRNGRTLGREFRGLRGCGFKRRFSRLP